MRTLFLLTRNRFHVTAALCLTIITGWAQSPFRTAKADGSIILDRGGLIQASLEEALFRVGYVANNQDSHADKVRKTNPAQQVHGGMRYGVEVQGKAADNIASIFRSDKVTVGSQFTASIGIGNLISHQPSADEVSAIVGGDAASTGPSWLKSLNYDWLTLQAGYNRSSSTLYGPLRPFAEQFVKKAFEGYNAQLVYNMQFKTKRVPILAGLALGFKRSNNVSDLEKKQVEDKQTIISADGLTQRIVTTTRTGLAGDYAETTRMTFNTDVVFYPFFSPVLTKPKASVAFNVFTRSTLGEDSSFVPGVGAFVTAPGAPLKVYGGVSVYRDKSKEVAVDLVAGFGF